MVSLSVGRDVVAREVCVQRLRQAQVTDPGKIRLVLVHVDPELVAVRAPGIVDIPRPGLGAEQILQLVRVLVKEPEFGEARAVETQTDRRVDDRTHDELARDHACVEHGGDPTLRITLARHAPDFLGTGRRLFEERADLDVARYRSHVTRRRE